MWMKTGALTTACAKASEAQRQRECFLLVFILWGRGWDGEDKVLSASALMDAFLESSLPKESVLASSWLLLKVILPPSAVSPLLSPLIPGVSCFCRNKGVNKMG